jgi:hypothetical protein
MKHFLLVAALLLSGLSVIAQSRTYNDIPRHSFEGIKTFDGKLFYTTRYGAPQKDIPYNYVIQIYNDAFERVADELVPVKYNSNIKEIIPHRGGLIIYIQSAKEGLVFCYDAQGKQLWQKSILYDKNKFHDVKMVSLGDAGFAIVRPDATKKDGFRITAYDQQMNEKWSQAYFPEKGSIDFSMVQASNGRIAVLARYGQSAFSKVFEERVYLFSAADGTLAYEKVVTNEISNGKPKALLLNNDGSTFVIGYTFDPAKSFGEVVTHLFYTELDSKGNTVFDKKLEMYQDLKPRLLSEQATQYFGFNDAPLIHFEHLSKTSEGYQIIGETYKYVKTPLPKTPTTGATVQIGQPGKLYVMDYVVMKISANGKLDQLNRILKPYKRIDTEGHTVGSESQVDEYFAGFGLFSYRFLSDQTGTQELISHNWNRNTPYIGFTTLTVNHENILNRIYLDRSVTQGESGAYSTWTFKRDGVQTPMQTYLYDVLPYHQAGKLVFYDYDQEELTIRLIDKVQKLPVPVQNEVALTGIPGSQFKGIMPIDQQGYYTCYYGEPSHNNTSLYIYHRMDLKMNTLGRSVLLVPNRAQFVGQIANGAHQVMVFQDFGEREWYLYTLNESGLLVAENVVSLDKGAKQFPTGNLQLGTAPDGFYMLQTYWDDVQKVNGILVIRLSETNKIKWSWQHVAENDEVLQLVASQSSHGLFAILHTQRPRAGWNKFLNRIMVLDDITGKLLYEHDLFDGTDSGFPEYVMIATDKSVVTSGMYFKGNKFDSQNSDGIFFLKLKPDGTQSAYLKTPWSAVEGALKITGSSDFLVSGKVKVLIQDMVMMPDGSYKVIGELYKKSVGTTGLGFLMGDDLGDRAFSIYDFIVFDYTGGKLASVYRIPKAEQNIELPGSIGQMRGLSLSLMMRRYNMFSYLKTTYTNGSPQLVFTNTIDRNKFVFAAPVGVTQLKQFPSAPAAYIIPTSPDDMNKLDRITAKLDQMGHKLEKTVTGTDQTFTTFNNPYRGFAVAVPTEVLVYVYDPDARTLFLRLEKIK